MNLGLLWQLSINFSLPIATLKVPVTLFSKYTYHMTFMALDRDPLFVLYLIFLWLLLKRALLTMKLKRLPFRTQFLWIFLILKWVPLFFELKSPRPFALEQRRSVCFDRTFIGSQNSIFWSFSCHYLELNFDSLRTQAIQLRCL